MYRVFIKIVFFPKSLQPIPVLHVKEQLILATDPSVQSLLLVDHFCTANSSPVLAKERGSKILKILGKTTKYLMNTLYIH